MGGDGVEAEMTNQEPILLELISEFRTQSHGIQPAELRYLTWDLRAPIQLFDYHVGPLDHHLISFVHSSHRPDGFIRTVGPLEYPNLGDELVKSLQDPAWLQEETRDPTHLWALKQPPDGSPPRQLRLIQKSALAIFYRNVQARAFSRPLVHRGFLSAHWDVPELGHIEWMGSLDVDPAELIRREIQTSRNEYASRQAAPRVQLPVARRSVDPEPWHGHWTVLYPTVSIGTEPEPSFEELAYNFKPRVHERPDFKWVDSHVLYSHDGVIGVLDADDEGALKLINMIAFAITRRGIPVHFAGPGDYGSFRMSSERGRTESQFGSVSYPLSPERGHPSPTVDPFWAGLDDEHVRHITQQSFEEAVAEAKTLLRAPNAPEILLVLEAESWLLQARHTNAFLLAWFAIEANVSARLENYLSTLGQPAGITPALRRERIVAKGKILKDAPAPFTLPNHDEFERLRNQRNTIIHHNPSAGRAWAERAIRYARLVAIGESSSGNPP